MLRIVHLTDFHLNKQTLRDWNNFIKDSLILKLKDVHAQAPISFIAFTGDMIDKAGEDFKGATIAFNTFKDEVINPILESLSLPIERFLIVPGNHDIVRTADDEPIELGYAAYFKKDYNNVLKFMVDAYNTESYKGIERIKEYNQFIGSLYKDNGESYNTIFGNSFKFYVGNTLIGISCLNSSWRCYNPNDFNQVLIGEEQLIRHTKFISNCEIKVALVHHPLDWLSDNEKSTISSHIIKDFDILLVGHVHENNTTLQTGFTGSLFMNVSPSGLNNIRSDSRKYPNGFTIVDFDKTSKTIECEYLRYNHDHKQFILNTDAGVEGKFVQVIPSEKSAKRASLVKKLLSNIVEDHYQNIDNHLIGTREERITGTIKEAFIMPPIDQGNYTKEENKQNNTLTISEIVKSKLNLIFFGGAESGKTTLLFRILREFVDEFEYLKKIPIYIDIEELGNKEIITSIKEFLKCGSEDVKYLIEENKIILLVDNLKYKKDELIPQKNRLNRFFEQNEGIQIIATSEYDIAGIIPPDYIHQNNIPFKNYFIRSLRAREIKSLMKLWIPEDDGIKHEERLERMVSSFSSYALPSTAMSVSLFLWSMENTQRKPVNNAVLMDIYIEIILEKLKAENIYREHFDYTNKVQLLAKIAQEMLIADKPNYSILYSDFIRVIEGYLRDVGFTYDASVIAKFFIDRKLFIKYQTNRIKFTYSCFFHFFLAKRMEYNLDFKSYVLDEANYHKYVKEIDYYTGLTRSDEKVLEEILTRFERDFKPTDFVLEHVEVDKYFTNLKTTSKDSSKSHEPIAKNLEISKIKDNRPSEEMMEEFINKRLDNIPDPGTILQKGGSISLETLLVIMSNVLRNSEGVENRALKAKAYNAIIKYSIIWMVLYRESLIEYVIKFKKLPPSIPFELNLEYILKNIPYHVHLAMTKHLGTPKMASIILDKILKDRAGATLTNSDIETFLSVALYSDIQGNDYPKHLNKLVNSLKNNIVSDYVFYKLMRYYYTRSKPGSPNEKIYLDLLSELRIRSQHLPQRMKERVIKAFEDGKKAFLESTTAKY